jgi:hypothetical protein
MSIEALPCIICGTSLKNVWQDAENQPNDGVACTTRGNYGSTVFDPVLSGEFLEFNLCDPCLVKAGEQGRIYMARTAQPIAMGEWGIVGWYEAPYVPVTWHQGMPGYEDTIHVDDIEEFRSLGKKARLSPGLEDTVIARPATCSHEHCEWIKEEQRYDCER